MAGRSDRQHRCNLRTRALLVVVVAVLGLSACADGPGPGQFSLTATGGQTHIFYDPPSQRGTVPAIAGESLTAPGARIGTADFPGQVVVLNVWGSWCGPCRAETPQLEQVQQQSRDRGVQFLGIDVRDEIRSAALDFVRDRQVSYPSIYDPPGRSLLGLRGYPRNVVPSTIVLDRSHRVAAVFLTAVLAEDIAPVVDRVAAEPTPPGAAGRPAGRPQVSGAPGAVPPLAVPVAEPASGPSPVPR